MQNKFLKPIIYAAILILGFYLGMYISKSNGNFSKIQKGNGSDITLLKDVFSLIDNEYVDTVNLKSLQSKAITHVLESMDPHSEYIEPSILTEVNENLQSSFHGIGVSFRIEKDTITILEPVKGGPSEKVGILAGDRIVYVDDSLVAGNKVTNKTAMSLLNQQFF